MRKVTFIGLVLSLLVATGPAIWYWVIDLLYYDHTEGLVINDAYYVWRDHETLWMAYHEQVWVIGGSIMAVFWLHWFYQKFVAK